MGSALQTKPGDLQQPSPWFQSSNLEGVVVNIFTLGLWGTVDQSLQWIGKGAARLLARRSGSAEENAIIGGALVCAVFGGVTGFTLSDFSRSTVVSGGAIIGGLLGACSGVLFGSFVVTVDDTIKHVLASLKSK